MAASRVNYIVIWEGSSQVYGCAGKEGALETPPPSGYDINQKRVFFLTYQPDNELLTVHQVPQEEVLSAELKLPTPRKKKDDSDPEV